MSTSRRRRPKDPDEIPNAARWLVTGTNAVVAILHEGRTAHLQPARSGEHPYRYNPGQRLALKAYIPGPTEAHVIVTAVRGRRDKFRLSDLTDAEARDLGYEGLDTFRLAWVREYDPDWWQRLQDHAEAEAGLLEDPMVAFDKVQARFEQRWAGKLAWLIRFRVDTAAAPRLLAVGGQTTGHFVTGSDGRHRYVERAEDREGDRGYTSVISRSLPGELPALTDEEYETHIAPAARARAEDRVAQQRDQRAVQTDRARLAQAEQQARLKGFSVRDERRRYDRFMAMGKPERARRQLDLIEQRVYPDAQAA